MRCVDKTIVVGLDDTSPGGEVYVYVGNKRRSGSPVERAGLHGGTLYGIKVDNGGASYANAAVVQENAGPINGTSELKAVTDPAYVGSGAALQTFSTANGFTKFVRPGDGAWDTQDPLYRRNLERQPDHESRHRDSAVRSRAVLQRCLKPEA